MFHSGKSYDCRHLPDIFLLFFNKPEVRVMRKTECTAFSSGDVNLQILKVP